jgi:hypothetical protein
MIYETIKCGKCGKTGHHREDCPQKDTGDPSTQTPMKRETHIPEQPGQKQKTSMGRLIGLHAQSHPESSQPLRPPLRFQPRAPQRGRRAKPVPPPPTPSPQNLPEPQQSRRGHHRGGHRPAPQQLPQQMLRPLRHPQSVPAQGPQNDKQHRVSFLVIILGINIIRLSIGVSRIQPPPTLPRSQKDNLSPPR